MHDTVGIDFFIDLKAGIILNLQLPWLLGASRLLAGTCFLYSYLSSCLYLLKAALMETSV